MKLRTKIYLLAPLSIVGMLLLGTVLLSMMQLADARRHDADTVRTIRDHTAEIEATLLRNRLNETRFQASGDLRFVEAHHDLDERMLQEIGALIQFVGLHAPGQIDQDLAIIKTSYEDHARDFNLLAVESATLGRDETSGLTRRLHDAIRQLEADISRLESPRLDAMLLKIQQSEQDFRIGIDRRFVDQMMQNVSEFVALPDSRFPSGAIAETIRNKLRFYEREFAVYAQVAIEENRLANELAARYETLSVVFDRVRAFAFAEEAAAGTAMADNRQQMFWVFVGCIIAMSLILGTLIHAIARSVTRPLASVIETLTELSNGNTDIQVADVDRHDEIGAIFHSIQAFRDAAIERAALEVETTAIREEGLARQTEREAERTLEINEVNQAVVRLGAALEQLADGDLSGDIEDEFSGNLDLLRSDFNSAIDRLSISMGTISNSAEVMALDSADLHAASASLATRTDQQAATLATTASSLSSMSQTVATSSERAHEVARVAADAKESTVSSGEVVAKAIVAMSRIQDASLQIGKIVTVIDDIAFQTNLLALNAGVEAARAGESGRGFAVVAHEVRELAQRAASSAKDIKSLIHKSGLEVEDGVGLVRAAGDALEEIASHVDIINKHIASVAENAKSQAEGLKEISSSVTELDDVTQQNASMVQQSNVVTHRLSESAAALLDILSKFKLRSDVEDQLQLTRLEAVESPLLGELTDVAS